MDDEAIIELYESRDENAISETKQKYGRYLTAISYSILNDESDSEECVSDTYLKTWNSIPPHKPNVLKLFLARITRNLSFNRYKQRRAEKRGGGEISLVLDELSDVVSGVEEPIEALVHKELIGYINTFLSVLSVRDRGIFLSRYFYVEDTVSIAKYYGIKEENVRLILSRTRKKLREYLEKEGYEL